MDIFGQIPTQLLLFFILYGITGAIPFIAALYLLLCPGNAFAPGVTPPVRLRRWAASFFIVSVLGHVWWILFYIYFRDIHSPAYMTIVMLDCVTLLTTIAGTLLSMLQDRQRPMWPVFVAMIPFVAFGGILSFHFNEQLLQIAVIYVLLLYAFFTIYMVFAVWKYGRWLRDNYADLEHKEVWLSQAVTLGCLLFFILYAFGNDVTFTLILHLTEFVMFVLLLWRVETMPNLTPDLSVAGDGSEDSLGREQTDGLSISPALWRGGGSEALAKVDQLLAEHCVGPQLYLQHDLTLQQLALAVGTNRSYLSQYFSRQGITYNTYINNLRINHFVSLYHELAATGRPIIAQQLASESGYRSYSTFSLAFKQRTGQSVTAWMRDSE